MPLELQLKDATQELLAANIYQEKISAPEVYQE